MTMAISDRDFTEFATLLAGRAVGAAFSVEVHQRFPRLTVTCCVAADVDYEVPYCRYPGINLHLVDRSDHCWCMTSDPGCASGIVLAMRNPGR